MQFYSFCFQLWFGTGVRVYNNFNEYINDFSEISAAISGGSIDTYKFSACDEEAAYKKAKQYYKNNGWAL